MSSFVNIFSHILLLSGCPSTEGWIRSIPGLRVLLIHPLLGLLEKAHGLLGLVGQVLHEHAEILVLPEDLHFALVSGQDGSQVLVCVWQQVQDVRRAILQRHLWVLAQTHHLEQKHRGGE